MSVASSILHVVASSMGGGAVHVQTLTAGLAGLGVRVSATMPQDGGHILSEDFERTGVHFASLPPPPRSTVRRVSDLRRLLRREVPLLVHAHGTRAAFWTLEALRSSSLRSLPLIFTVHGYATPFHSLPRRLLQTVAERRIARRAAAVVAVSEAERDALLNAHLAPPEKVFTIRPGLHSPPFVRLGETDRSEARRRLGLSPTAIVILTVCRHDRPRDFRTLLHGFRIVLNAIPQAVLLVVGDGPLRGRVEHLVHELHLDRNVVLLGLRKDVAVYHAAADVFVLTSDLWEGLPVSVLEAQAASLPVVVTDVGGSREAILPDRSGVLIPPRAAGALGSALLLLAREPSRSSTMGATGREWVVQRFGVERMAQQTLALYESCLRQRVELHCARV